MKFLLASLVVVASAASFAQGGGAQIQSNGLVYPVVQSAGTRVQLAPAPSAASAAQGVASGVLPRAQQRATPASAAASAPMVPVPQATGQRPSQLGTQRVNPDGTKTFTTGPTSPASPSLDLAAQLGAPSVRPAGPAPASPGRVVLPTAVAQALDRSANQSRMTVSQGVTEMVKIGRIFPNRFITPFECAQVSTTDEALTHNVKGGVVTLATSSDKPIGVYLQDCGSDRAIGVTLLPEDIPQRELRLVLDDTWDPPVVTKKPVAEAPKNQGTYIEGLKTMLRAMALGAIPDGHVLAPVHPELVPDCRIPGISTKVGQILEGSLDRIAVYTARNDTTNVVPIQEQGCYMSGVLAVAAFSKPTLNPGEMTEVYVVIKKGVAEEDHVMSTHRPSLLDANQ